MNDWVIKLIKELGEKGYFGKVILNFANGQIPKITKEESLIKPEDKQSSLTSK